MSTTPAKRKADALLWLAGGKSNRVAAEAAGVAVSTVAAWKRDRVFAAELVAVRAVYEQVPRDAGVVLARLEEAERRLDPSGRVAGDPVVVSIPSGASPRRRRQLLARGIVEALEGGE
ncbi:hypothetical protein [Streptomyces sp. NBC_01373]|uniref:hypothetical protein n=1 Tax=Streptomyces sp. NBC_01373 TaxID=2903843 RepID=UPI00225B7B83|nr:hypothetical protein [Streptomyces sp. NBC_01373]MCX4699528.1 hypothetical protein [Streptomyces sp. NBC_01373]